ncbi:MAG: tryptophan synthase subunit alpha [Eubacteriales bacterium]|nr:tryptophan synthase subunit alpha [Eubacteriales bacterium]
MTRIGNKFLNLKKDKEKALVPFFFAGDPDLKTTYQLVLAAERAGADIIELGIPYSDPLADGPVNQAASARALKNGIRLKDIFSLVEDIRKVSNIPIAFLLYFNCIMQYGMTRFLSDCVSAGVDGLVIPDLPYEERERYKPVFAQYNVDIIPLVTPASKERIKKIVADSGGFVYCVTSSGVTGVRRSFGTDFAAFMRDVAQFTDTPKVLGFGISTPEQVAELKEHAEGVIVGSAIVALMANSNPANLIGDFSGFVALLKSALR